MLSLTSVCIEPNNCELWKAMRVRVCFTCLESVPPTSWRLAFIADYSGERVRVELTRRAAGQYDAGSHTFELETEEMDLGHIERQVLANVGLLQLSVASSDPAWGGGEGMEGGEGGEGALSSVSGERVLLEMRSVTQVTVGANGHLIRSFYDPID